MYEMLLGAQSPTVSDCRLPSPFRYTFSDLLICLFVFIVVSQDIQLGPQNASIVSLRRT